MECFASTLCYKLLSSTQFGCYLLSIRMGVVEMSPDAIQLTEYAHLHLFSGFVGEGDGKNLAICLRVLHKQLDVFHSEAERLSAARTGFIDG